MVNGENASGVGVTPKQAQLILDAGCDVITLGNHTWNKLQIAEKANRVIMKKTKKFLSLPTLPTFPAFYG